MRRIDRTERKSSSYCSGLCVPFTAIVATVLIVFIALALFLEAKPNFHGFGVNPSNALENSGSLLKSIASSEVYQSMDGVQSTTKALDSNPRLITNDQKTRVDSKKPKFIEEAIHGYNPIPSTPKPTPKAKHKPVSQSEKKPKRKANKYWTPKVFMKDPDWGSQGELKYIDMIPTPRKIMIKKDRKVVFPNITVSIPRRSPDMVSPVETTVQTLKAHFLLRNPALSRSDMPLDEVIYQLKSTAECSHLPIFLTMATVGDILYWQLIENFVYTLSKFDLVHCGLVICVSDPICMRLCKENHFPCYDFRSDVYPSTMEKIAMLKLRFIPRALLRGVDMFMLDLDVGFLADPHMILQAFEETPIVDIFVQEDYLFIMNRSVVGWKQWFTEPLPNIGAFLCRGNNRTHRVFEIALEKYLEMDDPVEKSNPGKDQNHVLEAMRIGRGTFGLKYAYLSNNTAPLLDKVILHNSHFYELGGEVVQQLWFERQSMLIHTTCYEKSTKVMGLKASNAYWNPFYYNPQRKTLTKQLLYQDDLQILDEVRSLLFLASLTGRALIIPNLLGRSRNPTYSIKYGGQHLFPAFRVLHIKKADERLDKMFSAVQQSPQLSPVLEPSFYWRTERDYGDVPEPEVAVFRPDDKLIDILARLKALDDSPRLILHGSRSDLSSSQRESLAKWAKDSVGLYSEGFESIRRSYVRMPSTKDVKYSPDITDSQAKVLAKDLLFALRPCKNIFNPPTGNRTCFQICD